MRRWRLGLNGGAIALVLLLLVPFVRRRPTPQVETATPAPAAEPVVPTPPMPAVPAASPEPAPRPRLADAAEVCVDLARVLDGRDVQPLFDRAAAVLGAKGLVLWMVDGDRVLRPSLTHGYPDRILQRLGPLQTDADNVTALAFRSMQVQVFSGPSRGASGAIAVPLITPAGCVGVLAAEVGNSDRGSDTVSIARLLAAQFAAVLGPAVPSAPQATAQA